MCSLMKGKFFGFQRMVLMNLSDFVGDKNELENSMWEIKKPECHHSGFGFSTTTSSLLLLFFLGCLFCFFRHVGTSFATTCTYFTTLIQKWILFLCLERYFQWGKTPLVLGPLDLDGFWLSIGIPIRMLEGKKGISRSKDNKKAARFGIPKIRGSPDCYVLVARILMDCAAISIINLLRVRFKKKQIMSEISQCIKWAKEGYRGWGSILFNNRSFSGITDLKN